MEPSIPIGFLVNPVITWLSKFFFYETYLISNEYYLKQRSFLQDWENLTPEIEVSVHQASIFDNDSPPFSKVAIRTSDKNHVIKCVEIIVEAKALSNTYQNETYQNKISAYNITNTPTILVTPSIPIRELHHTKERGYYFSYHDFSICLLNTTSKTVIIKNEKQYSVNYKYSFYNDDLLNSRFVKRWGMYWNMDEIDFTIKRLKDFLYYHLVQIHHFYPKGYKIPFKSRLRYYFISTVGKSIYFIISKKWFLNLFFWTPIILKFKKFKAID
ncbi:hypothetical protein ACMV5I_09715 [Serratia sp. T13T92]|uniref:hypothetical protein n=1 Tax=Serratia sp. T13T92 TaxID=3397496 RepID=UPI0039E092CC